MKKFSELFLEVFDQTLPNYDSSENPEKIIRFSAGGKDQVYQFEITRASGDPSIARILADELDVEFEAILPLVKKSLSHDYGFLVNHDHDQVKEYAKHPKIVRQIFGTTLALIKRMVDSKKPDLFTFTANGDESSRVKLYDALFRRMDSPGYKKFRVVEYGSVVYVYYWPESFKLSE